MLLREGIRPDDPRLASQDVYFGKPRPLDHPLIKPRDVVGRVRPWKPPVPLAPGHTFGDPVRHDRGGAAALVGTWEGLDDAPKEVVLGKDYVAMNRAAVGAGAVSASSSAAFRRDNPMQRRRTLRARRSLNIHCDDPDHVYGDKTILSRPLAEVMGNCYEKAWLAEMFRQESRRIQAEDSAIALRRRLSPRRGVDHWVASRAPRAATPNPAVAHFRLAQFDGVPPRVDAPHGYTPTPSSPPAAAASPSGGTAKLPPVRRRSAAAAAADVLTEHSPPAAAAEPTH